MKKLAILLLLAVIFALPLYGDYSNELIPKTLRSQVLVSTSTATLDATGESAEIDLKPYAGKIIHFRGEVKATDISKPAHNYGGIKFMVVYTCEDGSKSWPAGCDGKYGTFDWEPVHFSFLIPSNISTAALCLGLQDCTGQVEFRNLEVMIESIAAYYPPVWDMPEDFKCKYDERVLNDIPRRGVMSPFTRTITQQDIQDMASWNVNLLRWQFMPSDDKVADNIAQYNQYVDEEIALLDKFLPLCDSLGIKVIIDMHKVPGGRFGTNLVLGTAGADAVSKQPALAPAFKMYFDQRYLDAFIMNWEKLARHFAGNPAVWAYDLCNEPAQAGAVTTDYLTCQYLAAKAIRKIDPDTPLLVEANQWDNPIAFSYLQPLPFKNVIYQVHFYDPGAYTHQGVFSGMDAGLPYPGTFYDKYFDRSQLFAGLKAPIEFEQKYGAKIFVGEFSAIRWAPNAEQYLEDAMSIFEELHWDWCYHAFREWQGWDVEYTSDRNNPRKAQEETPRKKVLLKYLMKNRLSCQQ